MMKRLVTLILAALTIALISAAPARSAGITKCTGTITSLPMTITLSGVWCLKSNLKYNNPTGFAIRVGRKDVTIDLGGFTIDGLAAGSGTEANGIYALDQSNITIRNGTIKGFYNGVFLEEKTGTSSGHLIEHIRADRNRLTGIRLEGDHLVARHNHIIKTGPTDIKLDAYGILLEKCNDAHIHGNTIHGVTEVAAYGILVYSCADTVVEANKISGLVATVQTTTGIRVSAFSASTNRIEVIGNRISGLTGDNGISGKNNHLACIRNVIHGFTTPLSGCNYVSGNMTP